MLQSFLEFLSSPDDCRPQTQGEEELQLQLALAMSREEADAEDSKKKSDDMRLQMAIAKSKEDGSEEVRGWGILVARFNIHDTASHLCCPLILSHKGMWNIN